MKMKLKRLEKGLKNLLRIIIILLFPSICVSLTLEQIENIKIANEVSKPFKLEHIIPVICGIETSFGLKNVGDNGQSLGITQVRFKTAKWWFKKQNINMSEKNLKYLLKHDKEFCILVSCSYFNYLLDKFGDERLAILAYNVGPTNVINKGLKYDPGNYLKKFEKYEKIVEEFLNGK